MFAHEQENYATAVVGGRWSHNQLYSPSQRPRIYDENQALGELGFINFRKFMSRAFHGVPVLEEIGKFSGRVLNAMMPITWIRDDVRKDVFEDLKTVVQRVPQMAVGAAAGFVAGGPIGAVAGAAVAATKKGKGFKFKVIQSGIMPGMTGAGIANVAQSLSFAIEAGARVATTEGFKAGLDTGVSAFGIKSSALAGKTLLGQATGVVTDVSQSIPSFIKTGAEVGFNVGQATGLIPGIPLTPGQLLASEFRKGVIAPIAMKLMAPQEQAFQEMQAMRNTPALTTVGYDPTTQQPIYAFSGLTFEKGVEGVVRDRVTNEVEISYASMPELLEKSNNKVISASQIAILKNQFMQQVGPEFKKDLEENYTKVIKDMYREKFESQVKTQRETIATYKSYGGAYAAEAVKAENVIEKAWNEEWMLSVKSDTQSAIKQHLPALLSKHADLVFVDRLIATNEKNYVINQEKIKKARVDLEVIRNRNFIPARASNRSRVLAMQRAKEIEKNPVSLVAPQPEFLKSTKNSEQPEFLVNRK